jgi:hypothetical protein
MYFDQRKIKIIVTCQIYALCTHVLFVYYYNRRHSQTPGRDIKLCVCGGEKKEGKSKSQLHSCTNEIWKLSHPNLEVSPTPR